MAGMVGQFPGMIGLARQAIRGPVNPLDKSTVVSIYPMIIDEEKFTISPGRFIISPGSYDNPAVLIVGPSSWWRDFDPQQPLLEIPVYSIQIADSIVKDYCNGLIGCNMGNSMPGLFYIPGAHTVLTIKKDYKAQLDKYSEYQKNYYTELVRLADSLWARSNGNPIAISETMRMAARELNLNNKDWMKEFKMQDMERCFACGSMKSPEFPVCAQCHVIDPNHPKAKDIKFAV